MEEMQSPTKMATKKRKHDDIEEDVEEAITNGGDIASATDSPTKKALNMIAASFNTIKKFVWSDGDKDEGSQNNNNVEAQQPPVKKQKRAHATDGASFITASPQKVKKVTQVQTVDVNTVKTTIIPPGEDDENSLSSSMEETLFSPGFKAITQRKETEKVKAVTKTELQSTETLADSIGDNEEENGEESFNLLQPQYIDALRSFTQTGYIEVEEEEEEEEFDSYTFIKSLPPYKPQKFAQFALPPKQSQAKVTLVLDLDETLVHCSLDPIPNPDLTFEVPFDGVSYEVHVRKRPFFEQFLAEVSKVFEVVVFTASQKVYADRLLDILDPKRDYIQHRIFRDSCVIVSGNYLKDLNVLGRDLSKVIIVDNSPHVFGYQLENGIPIETWFDDPTDRELHKLLPFLRKLVDADDVRPHIKTEFKLEDKVKNAKWTQLYTFDYESDGSDSDNPGGEE
eukprot:TRINITY_DN3406_c0_g1_i1.p1 TRINITY_DN3406_c0_g1~~TRINITY_DN3406_c0_g1_i1.p1  ORF type:complete len:453 (-),score=83.51 TRINITY_DN3406_c0_g1_i1:120-1478(-)